MKNRGITNPYEYFNVSNKDEIHYDNLDNIKLAVYEFDYHFQKKHIIGILVDEDLDGFTSAAVMYNYIKEMDESYPVKYIMHKKAKAHGLSDDVKIDEDIQLLIIPDASSNDIEQCKELREKGIVVIILDHHETNQENQYAIVVNNQLSKNYSNKALSGVGVVYKFCQALDEYYWQEYADNYIDLVALGLISDVMDMRSYETKYLVEKGLSNISNKLLKALIDAQFYSINNIINIHNVQFYITPIFNGLIRFGSLEDKELLFKAMINEYEEFDYKKRGVGIVKENIYDRAARLAKNAKARQDKSVLKALNNICDVIDKENNNDKVIIVNGTDNVDSSLTGLVCMKIADKYDKPCVILNQKNCDLNGETIYGGSARNVRNSSFDNFKDILDETGSFDWCTGHQGAFGVQIKGSKVQDAKDKLNELFKDTSNEKIYLVDFILSEEEIDTRFIKDLDSLSEHYGHGIEEAKVAATINIYKNDIELLGKEKDTIAYTNNEGVKFVMFKCKQDNLLLNWVWDKNGTDCIQVEIVGKPCVNIYQGIATPQFVIEDLNCIKMYNSNNKIVFDDDFDIWDDIEW